MLTTQELPPQEKAPPWDRCGTDMVPMGFALSLVLGTHRELSTHPTDMAAGHEQSQPWTGTHQQVLDLGLGVTMSPAGITARRGGE